MFAPSALSVSEIMQYLRFILGIEDIEIMQSYFMGITVLDNAWLLEQSDKESDKKEEDDANSSSSD